METQGHEIEKWTFESKQRMVRVVLVMLFVYSSIKFKKPLLKLKTFVFRVFKHDLTFLAGGRD